MTTTKKYTRKYKMSAVLKKMYQKKKSNKATTMNKQKKLNKANQKMRAVFPKFFRKLLNHMMNSNTMKKFNK